MAKQKITPQDVEIKVTVTDINGVIVDLTQYLNYYLIIFNEIKGLRNYSKITKANYGIITPINETLGTFKVKLGREYLLDAQNNGDVFGQVYCTLSDLDFKNDKKMNIGKPFWICCVEKNNNLDYDGINS